MEGFHDIDYRDLADLVQRLREIGWRAALGPAGVKTGWPWHEDLDEFPGYIAELRDIAATTIGEQRDEAAFLLAEIQQVYDALLAGPTKPDPDEIIGRFIAGEIGDRTVQYVMSWDARELAEECQKRSLPPMQML